MWIPLLEKEFDLNLVQLRADGSFHIPVLKQTIKEAPYETNLMEYQVSLKKTDEGNELIITKRGSVAKRLRFDGEWSRYQEGENRSPNESTPVPGAPRKQLSLSDDKTLEQLWRENYEFRMRSYPFLQDKWDAADEYGVHIPSRQGYRRIQFLYVGWGTAVVAFAALFVGSYFFNIQNLIDANKKSNSEVIAKAAKIDQQIKRANAQQLKRAEDTGKVKVTPPKLANEENNKESDSSDKIARNSSTNNKNSTQPNTKPKEDKSKATELPKVVNTKNEPEKPEMKSAPPKKVEPEIPAPKIAWVIKSGVSNLEIGEEFKIGVSVQRNGDIPAKLYGHIGTWKEGESRLVELVDKDDLSFVIRKEHLVDLKVDDDGFERGTIAFQVLATNNESPYEEDGKSLKGKYKNAILFREAQPVRIHSNKRPVFTAGADIAKVDSGPIQKKYPFQSLILHGGKKSFIQPKARDPEGEPDESLTYEYKVDDAWVLAKNNSIPLDTSESGKFQVTVRATDKAKRISDEHNIKYFVNFPPKVNQFVVSPKWPVPGGPLRIQIDALDPEGDKLSPDLKVFSNDKEVKLERLKYFDSDKKRPVDEGSYLYQLDELEAGTIRTSLRVSDDRYAMSDPISKQIEIKLPKMVVPKTPGKKLTNSLGLEFVEIPAGEFMMGSPKSEPGRLSDEPLHGVKITKPFYMQTVEFPRNLYNRLTVNDGKPLDKPCANLKFTDGQFVCTILNSLESEAKAGRFYRLPTEAEWEYCCRGGQSSPFNVNEDGGRFLTVDQANITGEFGKSTEPSAEYKANNFGLYDMHGNVVELCADEYDSDFYWHSPIENPFKKPVTIPPTQIVRRGGGCHDKWQAARSASRKSPGETLNLAGLRLVCEIRKPRTVPKFDYSLVPDNSQWIWDDKTWKHQTNSIKVLPPERSRFESVMATKGIVKNVEFSCDFQIPNYTSKNKELESSAYIAIIPRGTLQSDSPPRFSYVTYRVLVGQEKWGLVKNDYRRSFEPTEAVSQKLEQLLRIGEKNSLKVVCQNDTISVWINDLKTGQFQIKDLPESGRFGILAGGRKSEFGGIEISNAKFKKLD